MKKLMLQGAIAAIIGTAALAGTATTASAEIVCNRAGDCWHAREHYDYSPRFGVVVHDDNWRWRDRDAIIAGASMKAAAIGATASGSNSKSQAIWKRRPRGRRFLSIQIQNFDRRAIFQGRRAGRADDQAVGCAEDLQHRGILKRKGPRP